MIFTISTTIGLILAALGYQSMIANGAADLALTAAGVIAGSFAVGGIVLQARSIGPVRDTPNCPSPVCAASRQVLTAGQPQAEPRRSRRVRVWYIPPQAPPTEPDWIRDEKNLDDVCDRLFLPRQDTKARKEQERRR